MAAGGRTGLASVVVAVCFALALFVAPLAGVVPAEATAPALIVVGYLMCALVREIPFADLEEGFPALLTMTIMPFSYSITNGIGAGVRELRDHQARPRPGAPSILLLSAAAAFVLYFALH